MMGPVHEIEMEQNQQQYDSKKDVESKQAPGTDENGDVVIEDMSSRDDDDALLQLNTSSERHILVDETDSPPSMPCISREDDDPIPLELFPPLPIPQNKIIRQETVGGVSVVLVLIGIFISLTHGIAMTAIGTIPPHSIQQITFLVLIYGEALVAIICLLGILFVDPGFIPRSPENCYPLPSSVELWFRSLLLDQEDKMKRISGGGNENNADDIPIVDITDPALPSSTAAITHLTGYIVDTTHETGKVYCTRCLVWREPEMKPFHCAICQRCCAYYDHHCPFFGRCIAGNKRRQVRGSSSNITYRRGGRGGNYIFFVTILVVGVTGFLTTACSLMYSLSLRYGAKWVIPIGVVVLLWIYSTFNSRSPNGVCITFRRLVVAIIDCMQRCLPNCHR
jgi:hypothetical protein